MCSFKENNFDEKSMSRRHAVLVQSSSSTYSAPIMSTFMNNVGINKHLFATFGSISVRPRLHKKWHGSATFGLFRFRGRDVRAFRPKYHSDKFRIRSNFVQRKGHSEIGRSDIGRSVNGRSEI
jgi:hypothetical protein